MFTVTLLGVFALAALSVAVMGANVYAHNAQKMENNFDTRTSLIYIAQKVRQCPGEAFTVEQIDGNDALVLHEVYNGVQYDSWIYVYDGQLKELMISSDTAPVPQDGQSIMELKEMHIDSGTNSVTIHITNMDGEQNSLTLAGRTDV
jgi:hypothetical protein